MKAFRIFGRSLRDSFRSVTRNISLSLASITCIMITLIIVGIALIIGFNIQTATKELKSDLSIVVFVSNDADEFDLKGVETQIKGLDNIVSVELKSKEELKKEMMEESDTFKNVMQNWDESENPLLNTYIVKVKDADSLSNTAKEIEKINSVSLVKYGEGMVEKLLLAFNGIEKAALIAVAALILVTIFLIMNTIKLTIFSRKDEIGIMRLVGASNASIRMPFIFEGMFIGLIGAIIPIVLLTVGYYKVFDVMGGKLLTDIIDLIKPGNLIIKIDLLILIIGMLVGMIGSGSAVKKYLKV